MKSNWQIARDHASDMTTHGNYRGDCPVCGGRKTFTATVDMGTLKYNCYKLGCDVGGVFDTDMTAAEIKAHMSRPGCPRKRTRDNGNPSAGSYTNISTQASQSIHKTLGYCGWYIL